MEKLNKEIKSDSERLEELLDEAFELREKGQYEQSNELFGVIYKHFPDQHQCLLQQAFNAMLETRPSQYVKYANEFLKIPRDQRKAIGDDLLLSFYHNLGVAYMMIEASGRSEELQLKAYRSFQWALELSCEPKTLLCIGELAMMRGKKERGTQYLELAAEMGEERAAEILESQTFNSDKIEILISAGNG
ncbi:MAG: hypothetical protein R3211_10660 [Balneolaceae bacterium]|nr:hypothetical protein [Balneolaceae bacterium]